ncbi:MAG: hydrolase, partial [Lachnospiraceae bacterium]|nr:hydrolase [Lachnospiraceae bacterium]
MEINALLMGSTDNVVTCVADVPKGAKVTYRKGDEILSLIAEEDIPYCHKIALTDIPKDGEIIKYDESL